MSLPVLVKVRGIPRGSNPSWDASSYLKWDKKRQKGSWYNLTTSVWEFEVYNQVDIRTQYSRFIKNNFWTTFQIQIEGKEFNTFIAKNWDEFTTEVWYRIELYEAFYELE